MAISLIIYVGIALGAYLVAAQCRGRLVGILSAILWPVIFGMWAMHRCMIDEHEMDWSQRVTWMPRD